MLNQKFHKEMNQDVICNFQKVRSTSLILPLFLLFSIVAVLYSFNALTPNGYVQIQKDYFLVINKFLSQFSSTELNLTQLGDASIFLSFLIILLIYTPKVWESLIISSIVSLIFSFVLKNIFSVPRPSKSIDINMFNIIGKKASGFSSLPSGHAITIFTILTILLFAFMPKRLNILYSFTLISIGVFLVFTRVGVGAHYPLDVVIGSLIGYISGLIGILLVQKHKICCWVENKKCYPLFMVLILGCSISMIIKIYNQNLIIFSLALVSLLVSLYKIVYVYSQK